MHVGQLRLISRANRSGRGGPGTKILERTLFGSIFSENALVDYSIVLLILIVVGFLQKSRIDRASATYYQYSYDDRRMARLTSLVLVFFLRVPHLSRVDHGSQARRI